MTTTRNNITRRLCWLLLLLLWFGTLGYRDLIHPDEGRYAEAAREMAQTGDWVTPHLNGLKYFEKPGLHYWISAAAFKLFGESEWVARFWPACSGFLIVLLLYATAKKISGQRIADFTALVTAGGVWVVADSHYLTLDMGLTLFMSLSLCGFLLAFQKEVDPSQRRLYLLLAWAAMGGAMLTKGLIGIVLPAAVFVIYTLVTRHWFLWKQMNWISGTLLFLLLTAPWFIVVSMRNPEFFHFFFIHEHLERYTTTEHKRIGSWYFFIPILLAGLLPWTSLLPQSLQQGLREKKQAFRPKLFLGIWFIFIFIFFSLSNSKLPSYILPVFPALSLLLAEQLDREKNSTLQWHAMALGIFWLLVGSVLLIGSQHKVDLLEQRYFQWASLVSLPLAGFCFLAAWFFRQDKKIGGVMLLSLSTLTAGQALVQGHQIYSPEKSAKTWVQQVQSRLDPEAPFYSVSLYNQTLPFYLKHTVTLVNWVDEFALGIEQEPDKTIRTEEEFFKIWNQQANAAAIMQQNTFDTNKAQLGKVEVLYQGQGKVIIRKTGLD